MRHAPLLKIAPLVADRVQPFEGERTYLATGDVGDEADTRGTLVTYDGRPSRADLTVQPGDVCFARMAATRKVLEFREGDGELILSTGFAVLRPIENEAHPGYLRQWLSSEAFQASKDRLCTGATQKAITNEKMSLLTIPVPDRIEDQIRIAEILETADALRAKRRAALAQLDTLTQFIFFDMFGDPATNPKGWSEDNLGALIVVGPQNGLYKPASDYGSGTPILRIDAFYDGVVTGLANLKRVRVSDAEKAAYGLRPGEIVINRVNSREYLGKSALIPPLSEPVVFESNMMRLGVDQGRIDPVFLIQLLQTQHIRAHILKSAKDAVNQSSINQQDVKSIPLIVPPLLQQELFARRVTLSDALAARQRACLTEMDALFASLQHRAFRGEL